MTIYVIQELGYEYNDEYYHRADCGGGKPVEAYRTKKNADEKCQELNEKATAENRYEQEDGEKGPYYEVVKVEVADDDVESYEDAREAVKKATEKARKLARVAFEQAAGELFAAHPGLTSFGWRQYTPYFNDGDTCTFGVRGDEPDVNGQDGYDLDSGREWDAKAGKSVKVREPSPEYLLQKPVAKFVQQFAEDDMKAMFGDHVRVTVTKTKKGVKATTEEYEHD